MRKTLVVGATGTLGNLITRALLDRGDSVRALVRPASDHAALVEAGAETVLGDLKDPASLAAACSGVSAVVTTANSVGRGGEDTIESVDLHGNRALIDAARNAGVEQFVFVSAYGASEAVPVPFLQAKASAEAHLRASGVPFTILSPDAFAEVWVALVVGRPLLSGEPVTLVGEGRTRRSFVSVADVAAFAVGAVGHPEALNREIPIGGPEPLSWRDVIGVFERVAGRPVEVRSVSPGETVPGLPDSMSLLLAGLEAHEAVIDCSRDARTFGVTQTPMETFARRMLGTPAPA